MMQRPGTVGRIGRLGLVAAAVRGAFSPASLFAAGEQGIWYDIGDFDRYMSELGPDIVVNGGFDDGLTGWDAHPSVTVEDSRAKVVGASTVFNAVLRQTQPFVGAGWYRIRASIQNVSMQTWCQIQARAAAADNNLIASSTSVLHPAGAVVQADFSFYANAPFYINFLVDFTANDPSRVAYLDNVKCEKLTAINTATLFQDAAGTIPVTAVEQPVGKILDKSGRGNHASQPTTTARGILRQDANGAYYIAIDGTDDNYVTSGINFTATDKMTLWTGLRKVDDTARVLCELSANVSNNTGSFYVVTGSDALSKYSSTSRGSATTSMATVSRFTDGLYPAPDSAVLTAQHDIVGDLSRIRRNGSSAGAIDGTGDKGTGNFGNYPLYLFSRGGTSSRWKGNFYGLIIRGAATEQVQLEQTEQWINQRMGGIY